MNDVVSIIGMAIVGLAVIGYMIRSSSLHVRQQSMVMKQQTDRLISEGHRRLEYSLAEGSKRLELSLIEGNKRLEHSIAEGNKRLETSLAEANRRHEENMADSRLWMRKLGYKVDQVFERVDHPEEKK